MYSSKYKRAKKIAVPVIIFFFIFQLFNPSLLTMKPAYAFADTETGETAGMTRDITQDVKDTTKDTAKEVKETVMDRIFKGLMLSASITLRNALVAMSRKMAEQTVSWMATGDWGQGAMFYEQAWGNFKNDIVNQTMGEFLDNLRGEVWAETGFDICDPALPSDKIVIMLGIELPNLPDDPGMIEPKPIDCSLSKFTNNWEAFGENIEAKYNEFVDDPGAMSLAYLQESATLGFDPKYAEVGVMLKLESQLKKEQAEQLAAEEKQRAEGQGQKAKTSMSGEHIQTPAYAGKKQVEKEIEDVKDMPKSEMEASKEVITEIPESMVAAFLNSFVSQAFSELIMKKLFGDGLTKTAESYKPQQFVYEAGEQLEKEIKQVSSVSKVSYSVNSKQIDLLTQFTSCSQDRQLYNCVIDSDFAQAVRAADQDSPLTLREAIEAGKVNGDLPLIPSVNGLNNDPTCYEKGWCYSNLVKLRTARIIPIGWELAAQAVEEDEKDATLKKAMDNFDTDGHKFYHLVDPDWVLRAPKARCEAEVPGPILTGAGASDRDETCSDLQTCLMEDESGKCKAWGYCAAEKNVFRFGGKDCDGQYDSCRVLTSRQGEEVKYLLNTVDKTGCDPNSVGCKWYSLAMNSSTLQWEEDNDNKIFLNKTIEDFECKPGAEGCTRFVKTTAGLGTNLIPNGGFEMFEGEIDEDAANKNTVFSWYANSFESSNQLDLLSDSQGGLASLRLIPANPAYSTKFNITPKSYTRYFAISLQGKKATGASLEVELSPVSGESIDGDPVGFIVDSRPLENVDSWENVYYIYEVKADFPNGQVYVGGNYRIKLKATNGNVQVDNVLFEEIDSPSIGSMHQYTEYASKNAEYVKQAPEYLQCYNVDDTQDDLTDYGKPLNNSVILADDDVQKTAAIKGCDGFAKLCTAEDVGCEKYSVTDGSRVVNGVVSFNDYCPQQCNGYATFSQSSTYFADGLFPEYLIPSTATQCSAAAAGCEEFTNLDEVTEGAEVKEYFSELRMCEQLPENNANCANFYTWVAEEVTGYQLKTYYLKNDAGNPATVGVVDTVTCNKDIFDKQQNPDCRAFYNDAGHVSYRLYSQTITCSTDCHPYRRSLEYTLNNEGVTAQTQCEDRQGEWQEATPGDANKGECVFMAIPSEGKTCNAVDAGCKEYKGNYSGDEEILLQAAFTPADLDMFETGGAVVTLPEGQVYDSNYVQPKAEQTSFASGDYLLSFWARKKAGADTAQIAVSINGETVDSILYGDIKEWSFYTYSFNVDTSEVYSSFPIILVSTGYFYTDNFQIKKVSDANYLIQNSWSTPAVCDYSLLNDVTPLPQAQVGCREYQDRAGTIHYLKTFSGLCSADKVGCEALIDTKNNIDPFEKEYDQIVDPELLCSSGPLIIQDFIDGVLALPGGVTLATWGLTGQDVVTGASHLDANNCVTETKNLLGIITETSTSLSYICDKLNDERYVKDLGQEYFWDGVSSSCKVKTVTIPADNTIYLVNTEKDQCQNAEKGCMALGLPAFDAGAIDPDAWETYFYRLDPELFGSLNSPLCQSSAQRCEEYKDDKGSTYFFKDPQGSVCEWKQGLVASESKETWFQKGTEIPCASSDIYGDGVDQLLHYDDPGYAGFVGECPSSEDQCTAFVDPTDDADDDGVGKAYYYLNNEQIEKTCTGVSRKDGCILFDDTSNPTLKYDADATYLASVSPLPEKSVTPTNADPVEDADSNSIIKVVRDRECAAWYDCKSGHWAWDPNLNQYQQVCDKVGVCTRLTAESDSPRCAFFQNDEIESNLLTWNAPLRDRYADKVNPRGVNWADYDYSGLAIPNMAPIHMYDAFNTTEDQDDPEYRLVNYEYRSSGGGACEADSECDSFCEVDVEYDSNGNPISKLDPTNDNFKDSCRCLSGTCVRGNPAVITKFEDTPAPSCRAYPNDTAPFPAITAGTQTYDNANKLFYKYKANSGTTDATLAGMDETRDYGCFYSQHSYGGGGIINYYPLEFYDEASGFQGFCQEDPSILCDCDAPPTDISAGGAVNIKTKTACSSLSCGADEGKTGLCMTKSTEEEQSTKKYYGWQGYCLERDESITINNTPGQHPCLTWYPSDSLAGLQDIKNNYEEAGYNPGDNAGSLFTVSAKGWNKNWGEVLVTGCEVTDGVCDCNTPDLIESLEDCYDDNATNQSYVKIVNSWGDMNGDGLTLLKNRTASMQTGSKAQWSYMEAFHGAGSEDGGKIYKDEIVGIVISCLEDSDYSDWCKTAKANLWYGASQKNIDEAFPGSSLTPDDFGGYFINADADDFGQGGLGYSGPIFAKNADEDENPKNNDGLANYATAKGEMSNYKFYNDNGTVAVDPEEIKPGYSGPWKDWTYYQVVWSGTQTNTSAQSVPIPKTDTQPLILGGRGKSDEAITWYVNRYFFGGDDYVLPDNEPWDVYDVGISSDKEIHLAPLFLGTGYNYTDGKCENTLTQQGNLAMSVCSGEATTPPVEAANEDVYKNEAKNYSDISCGDDCVGAWKWVDDKFEWVDDEDTDEMCVDIPGKQICANEQCRIAKNVENNDTDSLSNDDCADGWHCEPADGSGIGWCKYYQPVPEDGPENNVGGDWATLLGYCDTSYGAHDYGDRENYFGVRVMFDGNGKYSGLWTSICDDSKGTGGQRFNVNFVFKEYADKLVQVNKTENLFNESKAYTDKIYQKAIATSISEKSFTDTMGGADSDIIFESKTVPMGSAYGYGIGVPTAMRLIPRTYGGSQTAASPGGSAWVYEDLNPETFGGKPWGCAGGETEMCDKISKVDALTALKQYFAKIYTGWDWNGSGKTYSEKEGDYQYDDSSNTDFAKIPVIASVESTGKTDKDGNQLYAAVPGKITVNGKSHGNIEATDGNLEASLKFYAWAPDEQMPLRYINVRWGQDTSVVSVDGMFKNHKPRCQRVAKEPLGTCIGDIYGGEIDGYACNDSLDCSHLPGSGAACTESKANRFGDVTGVEIATGTISACEEAYYHFNNLYECTESMRDGMSVCPNNTTDKTTPCKTTYNDKEVCRYIPRVQVKDNWGWCNGDTKWSADGTIDSMSSGSQTCGLNHYEFYDGYIYISP